jgi:hypothetical protein
MSDKKCKTCGGSGEIGSYDIESKKAEIKPCPACQRPEDITKAIEDKRGDGHGCFGTYDHNVNARQICPSESKCANYKKVMSQKPEQVKKMHRKTCGLIGQDINNCECNKPTQKPEQGEAIDKETEEFRAENMTVVQTIKALKKQGVYLANDCNDNYGQAVCDRAIAIIDAQAGEIKNKNQRHNEILNLLSEHDAYAVSLKQQIADLKAENKKMEKELIEYKETIKCVKKYVLKGNGK